MLHNIPPPRRRSHRGKSLQSSIINTVTESWLYLPCFEIQ